MAKKLSVKNRKQLARDVACRNYANDECEIDNTKAMVALSEEGAFVQAWVWVSAEDIEMEAGNAC